MFNQDKRFVYRLSAMGELTDKRLLKLEEIRLRLGWTKTKMAEELGLPAMQNYANWVGRNSIPKKYLDRADRFVALQSMEGEKIPRHGVPSFTMLPVVSSVQAGAWGDAVDPYEPGDANDYAAVIGKYSDSAFVLIVEGESMTADHGLSIPHGSQVIVEPEQEAVNGDIVVAKLVDVDQAMIKKLVIDPPRAYLMPLNDKYEKTEINGNCRIVGVVKRFFMDIR